MQADLLVKNVRPWGGTGTIDLAAVGGKWTTPVPGMTAKKTIDAAGLLAVPGFIEPHIHLDKAMINREVRDNVSGTLTEAIEIIWNKKKTYTVEEVVARAGRCIESAVANGVTHIRSHVDVDTIGGLKPMEGVVAAREKYAHLVDIQIVAFPQEGILKNPGAEDLMWEAMDMGADVVGGMPFNEKSPADSRRHIEIAFEIAQKYDAPIDMHVDETDDPNARTLEMLAEETMKHGWQGRVTAGHTCALAGYPDDYAEKVIAKVKEAGIHMITNPATNLMLQGRLDKQPKRRGITRVQQLLASGINVAFGQDCIRDTFYPFGRDDMLEVALITAHAAHMSMPHQVEQVFAMPITASAQILGLDDYVLAPGAPANVTLIDAPDAIEAIRLQAPRRYVVRHGRVVAETEVRRQTWF
jgi:cytosine deaminase